MLWWTLRQLRSKDAETRQRAARKLGEAKDARAVEALAAALKDKDWQVRRAVAAALKKIGDARAVEPLLPALMDYVDSVRQAAAEALQVIDPNWAKSEAAKRAVPTLIAELQTESGDARQAAVERLGEIRDVRGVEPLLAALKDKSVLLRMEAARALGAIGDAGAVEPLVTAALTDKDSWVRRIAAEALWKLGDSRAVEPLLAALSDKEDPLREGAAEVLGNIRDARAVEPLVAALKDKNFHVRQAAGKALGQIGDARALRPLVAALKDETWQVRLEVAKAVAGIPSAAKDAVPMLLEALEVKDKDVRDAAAAALENIGATQELAAYRARRKALADTCPRCGKTRSLEKVTEYVAGSVCASCGWAAIWCYACKEGPMKATREVWPQPEMPLQAWLDCPACGKRGRADNYIINWLLQHEAL